MKPALLAVLVVAAGSGSGSVSDTATRILTMQKLKVPHATACRHTKRAKAAAALLDVEVPATLDVGLVAAVLIKESGARPGVVGQHGEIGYMQIKPDGMGRIFCKGLDIKKPRDNIRCGVRLLLAAREKCGDDPRRFLGAYNAPWRCNNYYYSDRVLAIFARDVALLADRSAAVTNTFSRVADLAGVQPAEGVK